ncbi:uncharacterized protein LOC142589941 [Dermacentor variabilis]|uniref:uncharacterized protein LOC142589941 n=1 Tax=Dermacentor variabilis TaxID=34621 RepID=UPI003F5B6B18
MVSRWLATVGVGAYISCTMVFFSTYVKCCLQGTSTLDEHLLPVQDDRRALAPTVSSCLAFHDEKIKWAALLLTSAIVKFVCLKALSTRLLTKQNVVRQRQKFIQHCNYIVFYTKAEICVALMPYVDAETFPEAHGLLLMGYLAEQAQAIENIFDVQRQAHKKNACLTAMGKLVYAHTAASCVIILVGALKEFFAHVGAGWRVFGFLWFCNQLMFVAAELTMAIIDASYHIIMMHPLYI